MSRENEWTKEKVLFEMIYAINDIIILYYYFLINRLKCTKKKLKN